MGEPAQEAAGRSDPRHRVVHIITKLELGGAQRNTLYTVGNLDPDRFDTFLVTGPGGMLDEEARREIGSRLQFDPNLVRPVRPWKDLRALASLTRRLRELKPDVVHTHSSKAGILGRIAARRARVPVILHSVHGFSFSPFHPAPLRLAYQAAERIVAPLTTSFLCVSRANLERGVELGLWSRDKAQVVRSGIPVTRYSEADADPHQVRRELGLPPDALVVGTVGNFKPQKAPLDLVGAFDAAARQVPEAHLVVAGDGPLRSRVEEAVRQAGLEGRVHLLGWRRDIPRLLRAFHVFLLVSLWEGLPRSLLQARAAGLPCVVTAVDGSPEAVAEGETGFLVPPGRPDEAGRRVVQLLRDPGLRAKMGERAGQGLEEFDIDVMVRRQEEIYTSLLAVANPSAASAQARGAGA